MEIWKILKTLREKHNLTQNQLAERVMVTRQAVSRWENGETQLNTDTLKLLSKEFALTALERAELPPYLGSTLRGVIGQALLQTDRKACAFLYENKNEDSAGVQITVKPYVIVPPKICMPRTIIGQGQRLEFEILLIGTAEKYIDSLITALEQIHQFGVGRTDIGFVYLKLSIVENEESFGIKESIPYPE